MNWQNYITTDAEILAGKPTVNGTRLSVDFILSLLEEGWTEDQLFENYPRLTHEALRAVFAYVREMVSDIGLGALGTPA